LRPNIAGFILAAATLIIINTLCVAAPALAAPLWQECISAEGGAYKDSLCSKEETEDGAYELVTSLESLAIVGKGTLEFEDSKAISGALRVKCVAEVSGKVGPGSEGKTETMTLTTCSVVKGSCESPKVSAVHLPWKTELAESESENRDDIVSGSSGLPGYTITCGTSAKVEDTCEFETSAGLEDAPTEGAVEAKFDSASGKAPVTMVKNVRCAPQRALSKAALRSNPTRQV
jgi:hypothetical protein